MDFTRAHFLITFTVLLNVRRLIRSHQRVAYAALFNDPAGAIKKLARDEWSKAVSCPVSGVHHTQGRIL